MTPYEETEHSLCVLCKATDVCNRGIETLEYRRRFAICHGTWCPSFPHFVMTTSLTHPGFQKFHPLFPKDSIFTTWNLSSNWNLFRTYIINETEIIFYVYWGSELWCFGIRPIWINGHAAYFGQKASRRVSFAGNEVWKWMWEAGHRRPHESLSITQAYYRGMRWRG